MNEILVLIISQAGFVRVPKTKTTVFELIEEPKSPFVPLITEVCMKTAVKNNEKVEYQRWLSSTESSSTLRTVTMLSSPRKFETWCNVNRNGVLVRASTLNKTWVVRHSYAPASLTVVFILFGNWWTSSLRLHEKGVPLAPYARWLLRYCNSL